MQSTEESRKAMEAETDRRLSEMKARMEARRQEREENIVPSSPTEPSIKDEWCPEFGDDMNIWLISEDAPLKCPKNIHGIFYTNDCYVTLFKRETFYVMKIWIGSDVSVINKAYALTKASELAARYEHIVVSMETCGYESLEFRKTLRVLVILKGSFSVATHSFYNKSFEFTRNYAVETTGGVGSKAFVYWGKSILCYVKDVSAQTRQAVDAMVTYYNTASCEVYVYDDVTKFLTAKKALLVPEYTYHLQAVTDSMKLITLFKGPVIQRELIAPGKIYIFTKLLKDKQLESIVYESLTSNKKLATLFRTQCWTVLEAPSIHYVIEKNGVSEMQRETSLASYITAVGGVSSP